MDLEERYEKATNLVDLLRIAGGTLGEGGINGTLVLEDRFSVRGDLGVIIPRRIIQVGNPNYIEVAKEISEAYTDYTGEKWNVENVF